MLALRIICTVFLGLSILGVPSKVEAFYDMRSRADMEDYSTVKVIAMFTNIAWRVLVIITVWVL